MIIDAHLHVGTWDHQDFLGRSCSLDETIGVLRQFGIAGAALCPTDQCDNLGLLTDAKSAVTSGYEGKLWIFPWVRPMVAKPELDARVSREEGEEESTGELDYRFVVENRQSVCGIKIHPSLARVRVDASGYAPILELAHRYGLVVLVHCGRWQEVASYRFAVAAARRYPHAKFLLAHAGGDTPPLATAAADLVASDRVGNVWFEFSGVREYWVIERNCALLGAERYLMGSDYGLAHPLMYIGAVEGMNLCADDKEKILSLNALNLFGSPLASEST